MTRQNLNTIVTRMDRWVGKIALVTGASSGIGAATVKALVREGLQVVGVARRVHKIEKIGEKLKNTKGKLYARQCDLSNEEDILAVFKWIKETLGGVDVLVNNAGVLNPGSLSAGDTKGFQRVLNVNVLGVAVSTREAVQSMKARQVDGHIFNINSVLGHYLLNPNEITFSLYPCSKFAVTAMTEITRKELIQARTKIKITSISPGLVKTEIIGAVSNELLSKEFFKANPSLNSEDVANAIVYALGTPPHVQVCELIIRPVGEMII